MVPPAPISATNPMQRIQNRNTGIRPRMDGEPSSAKHGSTADNDR